jgi:hypothetical protein
MALKWLAMALFVAAAAQAQSIDKNCMTCDRRSLDSLNTIIGPVRVNQVGYRTDDPHKRAMVGAPGAATFQVLRQNGTQAYSGTLKDQGEFPYKGRILVTGYYNSITPLYKFRNTNDTDSAGGGKERISSADFGGLTETGTFRVAVGKDTSLPFDIRSNIYNDVFETSIKYFGIARSGDDSSQMHPRSHMKDGSGRPGGEKVAGSLRGGWYDCGDFFKVGQTVAYAFTNMMLAYTLWPQKAEDRYGNSYNDTLPFGNDGIPDLLRESKVGADYVMRLYRASHEDGLLAKHDMYQEVGVWMNDHMLWDMPERQDAAPVAKGGAPRPVDAGAGSAVAAQYAGSLALFAKAWYPFDPVFADSCLMAARDIYTRIVIPNWRAPGYAPTMFYITQGRWDDDLAWAAAGLWFATGDTTYKFDLMGNTTYGSNPGYIYNRETFRAGFMAIHASKLFSPGGWVMDYQNTFLHPVWLMWKHIYQTDAMAAKWGIPAAEAQDTRMRLKALVGYRYARECTNSPDGGRQAGTNINIMKPYNLVWSSMTWGMNRYNMGGLLPIVAYHEMIKEDSAASARNYWDIILDNMNYNLGANPWDISFVMGAGSKNLQHPHSRISNPEGYNAGGIPYKYRSPKGALMGGAVPGQLLRDEWEKYDVTETCIDFSAQMVLPSQYLAEDLPPDTTGPGFLDVVAMPADTYAIVSWRTTELSRDTLFYSLSMNGPVVGFIVAPLAKNKMVVIPGLTPKTKYYFWFVGMDIYRNVARDDNRGRDYDFTTLDASPPVPRITDVKACNIRGNQASIFWWTDVPSLSAVEYAIEGANFAATKKRVDGDDEGLPSRFHKVTLKGLQPGTTYRYDVFSTPAKSDSLGQHYRFSTTQDFASYTVQMAATSKNASGAGAHFYLQVANNENKPYIGLDLRFYFTADAATAAKIAVHVTDKAIFGVTGTVIPKSPDITVAAAVAVPGVANAWYLPIHIADTLPVAGRLRFDLKMDDNNWAPVPFSVFANAWSVAPRSVPVAYPGVNLNHLWTGPDDVQMWNGVPTPIYVDNPYIGGYYNGVHIFGYTPDGDLPKQPKIVDFRFERPLPSPATSVRQDSLMVHFQGRTWGKPDVLSMQAQMDSAAFVPTTPISNRVDSVRFARSFADPQGLNIHEWAFWADRETPLCGCAWQRYLVNVDTMKVPPRPLHLAWNPAGPVESWTSSRALATVVLLDATNDTLDTTALVTLSSANPGLQFWTTATGGAPASSVVLVRGKAQVWVSSPVVDSGRVNASAAIAGSSVTSGSIWVRFTDKPPRRLALVWTPAGPIDAWSGGQRKSASVTLVDSAGTLLDTVAVVNLASSAPSVQFWSSLSGALPATSIALVHGVGTVWFSDALADTAALTASATVAGSVVADAALVVRFAATPPWPLADSAWTTDASCDGIPDSVAVRLSMALDAGALVQSATLTLSGKPLSIPAASIVASGRDVLLGVPAGLDGSAVGSGVLALHVTTGGRDQIVLDSFVVQDRVSPQVVSAAVMERFGAGNDTVRVEFSEPVSQPSAWPFAVAGATAPTSVVSVQKLSATLMQWVLSGSSFPAGSMLSVASAGQVRDPAGNALATCGPQVPVVVRAKPDPMVFAAITDPSSVGSATSVSVRFARAVRDQDMPDSFVVLWDNVPRTVPLASIQRSATDSSLLLGTFTVPSAAGNGSAIGWHRCGPVPEGNRGFRSPRQHRRPGFGGTGVALGHFACGNARRHPGAASFGTRDRDRGCCSRPSAEKRRGPARIHPSGGGRGSSPLDLGDRVGIGGRGGFPPSGRAGLRRVDGSIEQCVRNERALDRRQGGGSRPECRHGLGYRWRRQCGPGGIGLGGAPGAAARFRVGLARCFRTDVVARDRQRRGSLERESADLGGVLARPFHQRTGCGSASQSLRRRHHRFAAVCHRRRRRSRGDLGEASLRVVRRKAGHVVGELFGNGASFGVGLRAVAPGRGHLGCGQRNHGPADARRHCPDGSAGSAIQLFHQDAAGRFPAGLAWGQRCPGQPRPGLGASGESGIRNASCAVFHGLPARASGPIARLARARWQPSGPHPGARTRLHGLARSGWTCGGSGPRADRPEDPGEFRLRWPGPGLRQPGRARGQRFAGPHRQGVRGWTDSVRSGRAVGSMDRLGRLVADRQARRVGRVHIPYPRAQTRR